MRKTLEALYYGNVNPTETPPKKDSRYWQLSKKADKAYDQVQQILTESQRLAFEEYVSLHLSAQAELETECFIRGFRLSTRLILEALVDGDFNDAVCTSE